MAKRRNPKKEKAQRNRAYARQFRQKSSGSSRYKGYNRNSGQSEQNEKEEED